MEIKERKENKVLNRVEIQFSWRHEKKSTPSRKEIMDLVKTLEPGSNPDWIVVKDCVTRFGQPLTTGLAFIYGSLEAMSVEPEYIHKRHAGFRSGNAQPAAEDAPEAEASEGGDE